MHIVETLHCVENPHVYRVFYFRGMRSYHVKPPRKAAAGPRRPHRFPVNTKLPVSFTAPP